MDGGGGAHDGAVHERREIPAAPFGCRSGFGQVDMGGIEADGGNDEAAAEFSLYLGALGNVTTETLRAFTEGEFRNILGGVS